MKKDQYQVLCPECGKVNRMVIQRTELQNVVEPFDSCEHYHSSTYHNDKPSYNSYVRAYFWKRENLSLEDCAWEITMGEGNNMSVWDRVIQKINESRSKRRALKQSAKVEKELEGLK